VKWGLLALASALLIYPFILTGPFYWDVGVTFLLAAISASAWNIVGGYAGQVSVGQSMFFGIGAYVPLLFYQLWGWPPVAGVPAGIWQWRSVCRRSVCKGIISAWRRLRSLS
jgi:branched-chain amino acid transport system permease protein